VPKGFKPDVAAGSTRKPERDHIRLFGVGYVQYRKLIAFVQEKRTDLFVDRCRPQSASMTAKTNTQSRHLAVAS
jgi:hypothetical protein